MRKTTNNVFAALLMYAVCSYGCSTTTIPKAKSAHIQQFLKTVVADTVEKEYRSHGLHIQLLVTDLTIEKITKTETTQDIVYAVQGRVSYIIIIKKGKRDWVDKEGNAVLLGPEQVITHWFSSGVLEDKYMGTLLTDDRNRFTFYADKPPEQ